MSDQLPRAVFCYAYRTTAQGGFSVNLFENDTFTFSCFDSGRRLTDELVFALKPGAASSVLRLMARNSDWLASFPLRMTPDYAPRDISVIGIDGYPLFQMEDFDALLDCTFGSIRGHYARMMYNLLEEVCGLLSALGLQLSVNAFSWDTRMIQPVQPEPLRQQRRA